MLGTPPPASSFIVDNPPWVLLIGWVCSKHFPQDNSFVYPAALGGRYYDYPHVASEENGDSETLNNLPRGIRGKNPIGDRAGV